MPTADTLGSVVTFYSWKGGVGRTMALANVAVQLARKGKRVLAIDWDLEAPGLGRFFTKGEGSEKISKTAPADTTGLIGLLTEAFAAASGTAVSNSWQSRLYILRVPPSEPPGSLPIPPTKGDLHFLASGMGPDGYGQHVADFSWADFFSKARGGEWLESLRNQWRENYDYVLIDSRTGLTDSGGVCTVQMPDLLVLVFTSNEQSLEDGLRFVQSVQSNRKNFAYDRAPLAVLPLLSRWDGENEVDLGARWLKRMSTVMKSLTSSWLPSAFSPRQFLEKVRVPHVARFSFGEPLPVITHSLTDVNLPGMTFEFVARLIDTNLVAAGNIIDPSFEMPRYSAGYEDTSDLVQLTLVQDPIALHREIAGISKLHGPQSCELANFLNNAGQKLNRIGRFAEAEPLMRRALSIGEVCFGKNHPDVAIYLNNLASLLQDTNRLAEAEPLMRRALAIGEASYGNDHFEVAVYISNLAILLRETNHLDEAEALMRRALAIDEASFGKTHFKVATRLNNLATLLSYTNRLDEAEPLMRRALAIDESNFGKDHPSVAICLNNLATLLQDTNRLAEAEPLLRRALAIGEASFGKDHPTVAAYLSNLANLLHATNRFVEAEPIMRRALAIDEACYGKVHPSVAVRLNNLATLMIDTNRPAEAEPLIRRALAIDEASFGKNHPEVATDLNNLAAMLKGRKDLSEAETLVHRALAIDEASFGKNHPKVAVRLNNLAAMLKSTGRLSEAEPLIRRALAIDEASFGKNHPKVAFRLSNLAALLEGAYRFAEAEPLMRRHINILLKSYTGTGHPHPRLNAGLENYARLLAAMGNSPDKVNEKMYSLLSTTDLSLLELGHKWLMNSGKVSGKVGVGMSIKDKGFKKGPSRKETKKRTKRLRG